MVKLFELTDTPCDQVGSFLINDVVECKTESGVHLAIAWMKFLYPVLPVRSSPNKGTPPFRTFLMVLVHPDLASVIRCSNEVGSRRELKLLLASFVRLAPVFTMGLQRASSK